MEHNINKARVLENFSVVPNAVSQNHSLSLDSRGLLIYLLSLPETWEVRFDQLKKETGAGTFALRRMMRELEAAGHMRLAVLPMRKGAFTGKRWKVYADPRDNPEFGQSGNLTVRKPDTVHKRNSLKKTQKSEESKESAASGEAAECVRASPDDEVEAQWIPDDRSKEAKLKTLHAPSSFPSEREFDAFLDSDGLEALGAYRPDLYHELSANKWHKWSGRKWQVIRDWRAFVRGLDSHIDTSKN